MTEEQQTIEQILQKYAALSYSNAFTPLLLGDKVATKFMETALKEPTFTKQDLVRIKGFLVEAIEACGELRLLAYLKHRMRLDLAVIETTLNSKSNEHQGDQSPVD